VSINVGPDGVEYRGGAEDLETTGPSLLAVDEAGRIHVVDPAGSRIIGFGTGDPTSIDLQALDIASVTAIAADGTDLILVEIFFAPTRQRVHRLAADGTLVLTVDLPEGFRLEDGLSGVLAAGDGGVIIEFQGGAAYGRYEASDQSFSLQTRVDVRGVDVQPDAPNITIDGARITADLTMGLGGLRYLGTAADGTHVVERVDVVSTDPAFVVVRTVEWYSPGGVLLGSALVPGIEEQAIDQVPGLAITTDGRVYVLIALDTAVEVWQLAREPGRTIG
jgi:hypothetical protein